MNDEHRSSPVMVTSPFEWKMLSWDDKLQSNKQNTKQSDQNENKNNQACQLSSFSEQH